MNKKTIIVTGATGVLGQLVAKTFAAGGHNLVLLDRDSIKLDSLIRDLNLPSERLHAQSIDLLNGQAVQDSAEAVHSKFGSVHALIHLVGGWTGGKTIPESDAADLESMLNQHVWTTFHLLKSFTPFIAESKWGRVIIVSKPETIMPAAKTALYTAAKSAQESLVLTLAQEFKESGLTANVIHVKSIDVKNEGKGTTPAEIVSAMQYLFSEEANKVTGARIPLY
ncbi:SDR family oxidoreductase [Candidatus Villigracilis affinis]|uniref:SDR family NAD(P)-dependent oxidoreductase n=1 Tax=Candidatus Villigracilis affinis TaxID=3140682 RepID=UPI001D3691E6|nr:SDR family oxidoreductase [Anaerolineales bacterium]